MRRELGKVELTPPTPEPPEAFPTWTVSQSNRHGWTVTIYGEDDFYQNIQFARANGYEGFPTEAEARAFAVAQLRALADRIEVGEH